MLKIRVINGPNLNLLGTREPQVYGNTTLESIENILRREAGEYGVKIEFFQSNHEGAITDCIHEAANTGCDGLILNPGAYTHYSYAIRDAIAATGIPTVEVHLSNIHSREDFREKSVIAPVCLGQVSGLGAVSYSAALFALVKKLKEARAGGSREG
ncbi:MAG: type II 3-dehydroquinate dehydratase [Clostridiaceae bacterium]|jgi:3-dehydroquinate dehydratase-2|nr:type II 3-dehydroquinate dehydratase [Clostridiaceae bacterium]